MKKTISFEKKIEFPSMIGEITAISLDHNLKFVDCSNIEGEFIVSGTYKLTEASRIEEDFNYKIPADIILGECIELENAKIEIEDFYYEIENDYNLICYIDVKIEGVEIIELPEEAEETDDKVLVEQLEATPPMVLTVKEELENIPQKIEEIILPSDDMIRECDGDVKEEIIEETEKEEMQLQERETVSSLFENINESEETYSTYSVYILREEETIHSLIEKYKTTKEDLENYNDLTNLTVGSKIIIPIHEQ